MSFVLDNSVALAWCFQDEQTDDVMALLDRVTETGAFAPMLWPLEALNGLLAAERRKRLDADRRERLASFLRALPIRLDAETAVQAWEASVALAARHRLTLYDAAYLEVAQRRRLPIATRDRDLGRSAREAGIAVLSAQAAGMAGQFE